MCELVHCLVETILSFLPNAVVFSCFHHSNAIINSHNTCRWLFFLFEDNQWKLSHVHSKKLMPWPCYSRWNCLRPLWSLFSSFSPLFWLFLRLRCEVMNPCFIHGYKSTQKIGFTSVKHHWSLDSNILATLFLFHWERTRHPSCAQFSHVQIFSQYAMYSTF